MGRTRHIIAGENAGSAKPARRPVVRRRAAAAQGRRREADGALHRCAATGAQLPAAALVRFVADPGAAGGPAVVVDLERALPGPAVWVTAARQALRQAALSGALAADLKAEAEPAEVLVARVETLLVRRVQTLLGLARRAGDAVHGHAKCSTYLDALPDRRGRQGARAPLLAFVASDAAPASARKFFNRLDRLPAVIPVRRLRCLSASELGRPFDRDALTFVVVRPSGLALTIDVEAHRLDGVRAAGDETDRVTRSRVG